MTQQVEELLKLSHSKSSPLSQTKKCRIWMAAVSEPESNLLDLCLRRVEYAQLRGRPRIRMLSNGRIRTDLFQIGSSIMSLICLILPCVFYLYISASKLKRDDRIVKGEISADSPDEDRATWRE